MQVGRDWWKLYTPDSYACHRNLVIKTWSQDRVSDENERVTGWNFSVDRTQMRHLQSLSLQEDAMHEL